MDVCDSDAETQACAEAGRLDRLVVDPAKTILSELAESLGAIGASSSQARTVRVATAAIVRKSTRTSPAYPRLDRAESSVLATVRLPRTG